MQKNIIMKKNTAKVILLAFAVAFCTWACTKAGESIKTSETIPGGIVLLSVPEQIVAGDSAAICFRVNPSNAAFQMENLFIDCLAPDVYEAEISDGERKYLGDSAPEESRLGHTRASYLHPSANCSIVECRPDSLDGEELEGQYVAIIKAQSERNIIDCSSLALVCSLTGQNGEEVNISSETFRLLQIPRPENAVFAWSPQALSLHSASLKPDTETVKAVNDTINAIKWYLLARTYLNPETGSSLKYDFDKYIVSANVSLFRETEEIALNEKTVDFEGVYSGMLTQLCAAFPDITEEPFKTLFEEGSDRKYESFTNGFAITDRFGHRAEWTQNLNYVIPCEITYPLDLPEDVTAGKYEITDKFATLLEYGIDAEIMNRYPSLNTNVAINANIADTGVMFSAKQREDGLGIGTVRVIGSAAIKADMLCSRICAVWDTMGPGLNSSEASSQAMRKYLNIYEKVAPKE